MLFYRYKNNNISYTIYYIEKVKQIRFSPFNEKYYFKDLTYDTFEKCHKVILLLPVSSKINAYLKYQAKCVTKKREANTLLNREICISLFRFVKGGYTLISRLSRCYMFLALCFI